MQIIPAIDLRGGRCVRLRQGDYDQETVFSSDPSAMARRWVEQGAAYLHLVDLDGGLRTEAHIAEALDWGVARVILGTRALQDPAWLEAVCRKFSGKIVLGL